MNLRNLTYKYFFKSAFSKQRLLLFTLVVWGKKKKLIVCSPVVFGENFMSKDGDRFSETAVLHTKLPFSKKDPFVDEAFGSRVCRTVDIPMSPALHRSLDSFL